MTQRELFWNMECVTKNFSVKAKIPTMPKEYTEKGFIMRESISFIKWKCKGCCHRMPSNRNKILNNKELKRNVLITLERNITFKICLGI